MPQHEPVRDDDEHVHSEDDLANLTAQVVTFLPKCLSLRERVEILTSAVNVLIHESTSS